MIEIPYKKFQDEPKIPPLPSLLNTQSNLPESKFSEDNMMLQVFQKFDTKKEKFQSFISWVEMKKNSQTKLFYNRLKDYQFYSEAFLVLQVPEIVTCLFLASYKVVGGDINGCLSLWDPTTGMQIGTINAHESKVSQVFINQNRIYSCGLDKTIKIWNMNDYKEIKTYKIHDSPILSLAIDSTDECLVSGDESGLIHLTNLMQENSITTNGHLDGVSGLVFIPFSNTLLSCSYDSTIKIWNLTSNGLIEEGKLEGHEQKIMALAISPDGNKIASGGTDKYVKLWDLISKKTEFTLEGHEEEIYALVFSKEENSLISGSLDKTIKVWSYLDGRLIRTIEGHAGAITSLVVTRSGAKVFSGSNDKTIRGWILSKDSNSITFIKGNKTEVIALEVLSDSQRILTCGTHENTIKVWDLTQKRNIKELSGHESSVSSVSSNSNGTTFASGGADGSIIIWNAINYEKTIFDKCHLDEVSFLKYSYDNKWLVSGSLDKSIKVWEVKADRVIEQINVLNNHPDTISALELPPYVGKIITGTKSAEIYILDFKTLEKTNILRGHRDAISAIKATPDLAKFVSSSYDCSIKIWNILSGFLLATITGHKKPVLCLEIIPDGSKIISGSDDQTVRVWSLETYEQIGIVNLSKSVKVLALSPDGLRLTTGGCEKNNLKIINFKEIRTINSLSEFSRSMKAIDISPNGKYLAVSEGPLIKLWNASPLEPIGFFDGQHVQDIVAVKFSPDGCKLMSCGEDNTARYWDVETRKNLAVLKKVPNWVSGVAFFDNGKKAFFSNKNCSDYIWDLEKMEITDSFPFHEYESLCVAITPDETKAFSGSKDSDINIYDLKTNTFYKKLKSHVSNVNALAVTENSKWLISGSDDRTIKVWDIEECTLIATMTGHTEAVKNLVLIPYSSRIISCSKDKTIKIWELYHFKLLASLDGHSGSVNCLSINPIGTRLYSVSDDKSLKVWNLEDSKKLKFLEGHYKTVKKMELTPDGQYLISGAKDKCLIIWDLKAGKQKTRLRGHHWMITALAVSSDGSKLITGTWILEVFIWDLKNEILIDKFNSISPSNVLILTHDDQAAIIGCCDAVIRVWNLKSKKLIKSFENGHCAYINDLILTKDSKKLISSSNDKSLIVWNYENQEKIQIFEHENCSFGLILIEEGKFKNTIFSGNYDKIVKVWDLESNKLIKELKDFPSPIQVIKLFPGNEKIVVACQRSIHVLDLNTFQQINTFTIENMKDPLLTMNLSLDSKHIFIGMDESIGIWNLNDSKKQEKTLEGLDIELICETMSYNGDEILFNQKNKIIIWSLSKEKQVACLDGHSDVITAILSLSNHKVISGSQDKDIRIWDMKESVFIGKLEGHKKTILALAISLDEEILVSSSEDRTIRTWNLAERKQIQVLKTFNDVIMGLCVLNDGSVLFGGDERKIKLWNRELLNRENAAKIMVILRNKIKRIVISPDQKILIVYIEPSKMQIWNALNFTFINELELKKGNYRTLPVFLSDSNNRLILYFEKLIDCLNGNIVFQFEMKERDMISFFYDYRHRKSFYYINSVFDLYRFHDFWLQTYLFQTLKYDSITSLHKNPENFIKRKSSTFPFLLSYLHLISIFDKSDFFTFETLEEVYNRNVNIQDFYNIDIFDNTALDILILKKNTSLINKYFEMIFKYYQKDSSKFYEKSRFLNYNLRENFDMLDLIDEIIPLCQPDLKIISNLLNYSFISLDPSIYDNSLIYKELDDPIILKTDSLYTIDGSFIESMLNEKFGDDKSKKYMEIEENQSTINAKVLCIPSICDINNPKAAKIFGYLADLDPDNEIFENQVLKILADYIWETQIKFFYKIEVFVFVLFFLLYNINFIYLYPIRTNLYYNLNDYFNVATVTINVILLLYSIFCLANEMIQLISSGITNYFKSIWNYFDIILIPSLMITTILDILLVFMPNNETTNLTYVTKANKLISSICMFCFWFRLMSFLRSINETSSMIRLIFNVVTGVKYFVLFMILFMLTLSSSFYLLHTDNRDENPDFWNTFLIFYKSTVGDSSGITDYDLAFDDFANFFMICSTFIFAIILLNLLVSIIGDKHGEILEAEEKTRLYELINIVVDSNISLTTNIAKIFKHPDNVGRYLIEVSNEKHEKKEINIYESLENKLEEKFLIINKQNEKNEKMMFENNDKIERLNRKMEKEFQILKEYFENNLKMKS